jgi:hypothetical protein
MSQALKIAMARATAQSAVLKALDMACSSFEGLDPVVILMDALAAVRCPNSINGRDSFDVGAGLAGVPRPGEDGTELEPLYGPASKEVEPDAEPPHARGARRRKVLDYPTRSGESSPRTSRA